MREKTIMMKSEIAYDCILYDFDGTLADTVPLILECMVRAYEEVFGTCERTRDDLQSYIGLPLADTFKQHDEDIAKRLTDAYLRINHGMLINDEVVLFDGIKEALTELKTLGVKQGIVTSKSAESLGISLRSLGLSNFFDIVVTRDDTTEHKPKAEPLLFASSKLGVVPERIIYVGDAIGDIKCAINAGCASAFVKWSSMPQDEILALEPTFVLERLSDLSCIIASVEL